jgi:nucleoside-diphosphate kinase
MMNVTDALLDSHYAHLADKPFFGEIKAYLKGSPIVAMAWEGGKGSVDSIRLLVGPTRGTEASAGTIRGDFGLSVANNIVHASDSVENGEVEVNRFFDKGEIYDYDKTEYIHVYGRELE